jgi:soluble lytic murein transglycosylase-like protein
MPMSIKHYEPLIEQKAKEYGLEPALVKAVVSVESSGMTSAYRYEPAFWLRYMANKPEFKGMNPHRASASYGLMQVMYATAVAHGLKGEPEEMFIPTVGLDYGCRVLSKLLKKCNGDVEQALAQYNGGETGNKERPFRNAGYAKHALAFYNTFKK